MPPEHGLKCEKKKKYSHVDMAVIITDLRASQVENWYIDCYIDKFNKPVTQCTAVGGKEKWL